MALPTKVLVFSSLMSNSEPPVLATARSQISEPERTQLYKSSVAEGTKPPSNASFFLKTGGLHYDSEGARQCGLCLRGRLPHPGRQDDHIYSPSRSKLWVHSHNHLPFVPSLSTTSRLPREISPFRSGKFCQIYQALAVCLHFRVRSFIRDQKLSFGGPDPTATYYKVRSALFPQGRSIRQVSPSALGAKDASGGKHGTNSF